MQNGISLDEFDKKCAELRILREEYEVAKKASSSANERVEQCELEILDILKKADRTSYQSPFGTVSLSHRTSVRVPKDPESRGQFFDFLREKGIFEEVISVNSQTLNSLYKEWESEAVANDTLMDFKVPGLEEPTRTEILSFRKK